MSKERLIVIGRETVDMRAASRSRRLNLDLEILAEMDGFSSHEAVVVLAATNRPDVLNPALVRPGRFDRFITMDFLQKEARKRIIKIHTRKVPLTVDVDEILKDSVKCAD